jgi:hypothetical protein
MERWIYSRSTAYVYELYNEIFSCY